MAHMFAIVIWYVLQLQMGSLYEWSGVRAVWLSIVEIAFRNQMNCAHPITRDFVMGQHTPFAREVDWTRMVDWTDDRYDRINEGDIYFAPCARRGFEIIRAEFRRSDG